MTETTDPFDPGAPGQFTYDRTEVAPDDAAHSPAEVTRRGAHSLGAADAGAPPLHGVELWADWRGYARAASPEAAQALAGPLAAALGTEPVGLTITADSAAEAPDRLELRFRTPVGHAGETGADEAADVVRGQLAGLGGDRADDGPVVAIDGTWRFAAQATGALAVDGLESLAVAVGGTAV